MSASVESGAQVTLAATRLTHTPARGLTQLLSNGVLVGAPLKISVAGGVPATGVMLTRTYPTPLPSGATATLVFFNDELGSWEAVPSRVSADRRTVSATVHHLSVWTDMVGGVDGAMNDFVDSLHSAGGAIRDSASATLHGLQTGAAWIAGWAYYGVGAIFDVRTSPPSCDGSTPSWVDSTQFLSNDKNNPILWCVGHDPKQPDLLVVKARSNRGYAFAATTSGEPTWTYNQTFNGRDMSLLLDSLIAQDKFFSGLLDLLQLGQQTVGAGLEVDYGFDEDTARAVAPGRPLVTLAPPSVPGFLVSALGTLIGQDIKDKFTGWAGAIITVGSCLRDINNAGDDPLSAAPAAVTCLSGLDETIAKRIALVLATRHPELSPQENGKAAGGIVGRASIYLALVGPVFNSLNYAFERNLDEGARTLTVFPHPIPPTQTVVLNPFRANGTLLPGWKIDDESSEPPVDCSYDEGSPGGTTPDTHWCGSTADNTSECWAPPTYPGQVVCVYSAWNKTLVARTATALSATNQPASPVPMSLELADGSRWDYRIGGSYGGRADGYLATYYCDPSYSKCDSRYILARSSTTIDKNSPVWTVHVGPLGDPDQVFPPPKKVTVKTAWYIASPHFS